MECGASMANFYNWSTPIVLDTIQLLTLFCSTSMSGQRTFTCIPIGRVRNLQRLQCSACRTKFIIFSMVMTDWNRWTITGYLSDVSIPLGITEYMRIVHSNLNGHILAEPPVLASPLNKCLFSSRWSSPHCCCQVIA